MYIQVTGPFLKFSYGNIITVLIHFNEFKICYIFKYSFLKGLCVILLCFVSYILLCLLVMSCNGMYVIFAESENQPG